MKIKASVISGLIATETSKMKPMPTQKLFDDLFVIQDGFANIFLVASDDGYIAIDGGINSARIQQELKKLNIDPSEVRTVLITHSDIDHVNGLAAFPHAEIYLPEQEVQMLDKFRLTMTLDQMQAACEQYSTFSPAPEANLFGTMEYWPEDDMELIDTPQGVMVSILKNRLPYDYKLVRDGETLCLGNKKVQATLINGHTKGLTSYLIGGKYMFVGDGLSLLDGQVHPFNALLNLDETQHRKSIQKIMQTKGFEYLFTQHYGYGNRQDLMIESCHSA